MNSHNTSPYHLRNWLLALLLFPSILTAQPDAKTLEDLSQRAMVQIVTIQGFLTSIAGAENSQASRDRIRKACLKLFAPDATVEEKGRSGSGRVRPVGQYLDVLMRRGNRNPVIMNFKMLSALNPANLKEVQRPDGSIAYSGKVRFDQHYCRTGRATQSNEAINKPNCDYQDWTEKEVTISLTRQRSQKGVFWLIEITEISVINVR
ncbi:MAG: hypothetical protein AAF597_00550 [Bacteroidota bacterium]